MKTRLKTFLDTVCPKFFLLGKQNENLGTGGHFDLVGFMQVNSHMCFHAHLPLLVAAPL
jgi:hypothetical protein